MTVQLLNPYRHGGAAFNPLDQLTCLHGMWADDPRWANPGDGNPVVSWRNQSGGGDPAFTGSTGTRPTFRAASANLNGKGSVEFAAASSQRLDVDVVNIASPWKLLVVYRVPSVVNSVNYVSFGTATNSHGVGIGAGGSLFLSAGTVLNFGAAASGAHLVRARVNGASSSIRRDEGSEVTGTAGTTALSRLILGAGGAGAEGATPAFARYMTGEIAFYALYDDSTLDADLASLAATLKTYYGIA